MALGRPKSDDTPLKYQESFRLYQLSEPGHGQGSSAVDELAAYLEWAIAQQIPGFGEDLSLSPDGRFLAVSSRHHVLIWEILSLSEAFEAVHTRPVHKLHIVSDPPTLITITKVGDKGGGWIAILATWPHPRSPSSPTQPTRPTCSQKRSVRRT